jgi:hypothetical protein
MTIRLARIGAITVAAATCTTLALAALAAAAPAGADTTAPSSSTSSASPSTSSTSNGAARLATIQALAKLAIANRVTSLNATIPVVTANPVITAADRATLLTTLNGDLNGLTPLGAKIAADTTAEQAQTDYETIFTGYRVYALALPQVRYAAAVDDLSAGVLPKLTSAQTTLAGLLAGVDAGKNTAAVQAAMTDLGKQIAAITSTTTGLSATVLAYTPAQYNANHAILSQPRATLTQARADARAAAADIATVVKAIQ